MSEIIAKAVDVEVLYGNHAALDKINMQVKKGDIYALVGKNGAGKTTLLRLFTGQNAPDYGHIEMFGETGRQALNKARHRTGAIIETPAFYPFFSAVQNLEYYRIQRNIKDKSIIERILKDTGLYEARNKKFKNYSLGMKQRLGIALALMHEPEFLILDEPINGLDPAGIVEMRKLMLKLNREKGLTIIISSHILSELANMATCYGFIDHGVILKELTASELEDIEKSYIKLSTNNDEAVAAAIAENINASAYYSMDDRCIMIPDIDISPSEKISRFVVKSGYDLYSLEIVKTTLEDYFIQLLGGASIE
ncbi:MAG: ATP-binding cassette domain-containing protein [Coprococcus sp.]|nr:ATP-binding cassette domain-containing protein [Coprococcus sp.]